MTSRSLQSAMDSSGSVVDMLRASSGRYPFPNVPTEYTSWINEQIATREACVLADLSYHMAGFHVEGPDALDLFVDLSVNSFDGFDVGKAKQPVMCNRHGEIIGDGILLRLDDDEFVCYGNPPTPNWLQYNVETGDYDATGRTRPWAAARSDDPELFIYQVQGPTAHAVLEAATETTLRDVPFFNFTTVTIAGHEVRALRHGMAGEVGFELHGDFEHKGAVRAALREAGEDHGLRQMGTRSYQSLSPQLGWVPVNVPAVYTDEELADYRRWLGDDGFEAGTTIGGSFGSDDVRDYYVTPYDIGYEDHVAFDHEFLGREALEEMADDPPRELVTLVCDGEDVVDVYGSLYRPGETHKFMELPRVFWSAAHFDRVEKDGELVGLSKSPNYTFTEREMIALCMLDVEHSDPGTEVTIVWGEAEPAVKPNVEPHVETEIRATVAPAPYLEDTR